MIELPDCPAVCVEYSDSENPLVRFIILDEQGLEIAALSLDCAQSITEATLAFMEWEGKLSRGSIH